MQSWMFPQGGGDTKEGQDSGVKPEGRERGETMVKIKELSSNEPDFDEVVVESQQFTRRPVTAPAFRTVRELKKEQVKRPPSTRYLSHVSDAFTYVTRHVDPLMSRVVSELLIHKPQNVSLAMLEYFKWQASGSPELEDPSAMFKLRRGAEKTDRLYAVRHVTPLLADLVRDLALQQPVDILSFLIAVLNERVKAQHLDEAPVPLTPVNSHPASIRTPPPPTTTEPLPPTAIEQQPPTTEEDPICPPPVPLVIKAFNILLLGVDGAGKSTLLATLKGDLCPKTKPTVGFRFAKMAMDDGGPRVTFYDLGGGPDPRRIWSNYYHDVHGIVYMLDASCDVERWEESVTLLHSSLEHKYLAGKPLLVLANKQDMEGARTPEAVRKELRLDLTSMDVMVHGVTVNASKNLDTIDPRVDVSLKWLFERVRHGYRVIEERVQCDSREAKEEFARQEAIKDRERLKGFIQRACLEAEMGKNDCFTEEEGLTFLSEEIGANSINDLPTVAKDVAAGVGYQKHALQMVGNMKNPIAQGKKALEWNEIWKKVAGLRTELGLPEKAPPRE